MTIKANKRLPQWRVVHWKHEAGKRLDSLERFIHEEEPFTGAIKWRHKLLEAMTVFSAACEFAACTCALDKKGCSGIPSIHCRWAGKNVPCDTERKGV